MAPAGSPLSYRNFRWLWTGSLFSYAAWWIQQASMGWVVYEITGSGAMLGAVLGVRAIPLLALSPLAGVAADRYNRRRLLQSSQVFSALISLAFGAALELHAVGIGSLFAFSILMGATSVLDRPARQSMAFELVPREIAVKAVALNIIGNNMSRVLAPAIAGYLIAWVGVAGNFFVQGGCYLAAAAMVFLVAVPPVKPQARRSSAMKELQDGLRFASADSSMRVLFMLGVIEFFVLVPTLGTLFPIYAKDIFAAGPQGLGLMFTAIGIGGIIGGYLAGVLSRYHRTGLIQTVAIVCCSLSIIGLAASPNFAVAFVAIVFAGTFEMLLGASNLAALQMLAPEAMRGRITSLSQLYPAVISLGAFLIGPLADVAGARGASVIAAALCLVAIAALWAGSARLRELRMSGAVQRSH
jgi:MFS family permease